MNERELSHEALSQDWESRLEIQGIKNTFLIFIREKRLRWLAQPT
jgi:hypothetical protein